MAKKNTSWVNIFKVVDEQFQLLGHYDYNELHENKTDFNDDLVIQNYSNKTVTPYIKKSNLDSFGPIKHVEMGYFTPKHNNVLYVEEKEWLDKSTNIFYSALVDRVTIVLEKNEDKIKVSIFNFTKSRVVGYRYFKKESNDMHITFNIKTNNFYITTSTFSNRRRYTFTSKNDFSKINTKIKSLKFQNNLSALKGVRLNSSLNKIKTNTINVTPLLTALYDELGLGNTTNSFKKNIFVGDQSEILGNIIMEWFVKVRSIKVPNDYQYYLINHYPGIKILKKNNMNLLQSILKENGLNGKFYNRLLNLNPKCNITDLTHLRDYLGDDNIKQIKPNILIKSNNFTDNKWVSYAKTLKLEGELNKHEKKNIINIYNTSLDCDRIKWFINELYDHISMREKLKSYDVVKKIKAKTILDFEQEHIEWASLINQLERNKEVSYIYPSKFLEHIEKPIIVDDTKYFVKVLDNDFEYFNEGEIQHHCVRTYLDRYDSIIISVRKDYPNNTNRMTCEFKMNNSKQIKSLNNISEVIGEPKLVQARMKYNAIPDNEWEIVKKLLRKEFLDYVCKPKSEVIPTINIYNKITNERKILKYSKEYAGFVSGEEIHELIDLPF